PLPSNSHSNPLFRAIRKTITIRRFSRKLTGCMGETFPGRKPMTAVGFTINGKAVNVEAEPDTALLWVVREHLKLTGTKYGCGSGLCGACTVHIHGKAVRSCQTAMSIVGGKTVFAGEDQEADAQADRHAYGRQHLSLRHLSAHRSRYRARRSGGLGHEQASRSSRREAHSPQLR